MDKACGHCGAVGRLMHKGNVLVERSPIEDQDGRQFGETYTEWALSRCDVCEQPTLEAFYTDDHSDPSHAVPVPIYPAPVDVEPLPIKVRRQYESALRVKSIEPSLYAVVVRKMLEAVCQDRGAAGRDLYAQIGSLVADGSLPDVFARMATQLRKLGNWGAHSGPNEVLPEDVPLIEEFANSIIEYLYRAPAKVDALERALAERTGP